MNRRVVTSERIDPNVAASVPRQIFDSFEAAEDVTV
jgi:hypothetical protein